MRHQLVKQKPSPSHSQFALEIISVLLNDDLRYRPAILLIKEIGSLEFVIYAFWIKIFEFNI